jgi:glycosylphosphatidylinositol deacylase
MHYYPFPNSSSSSRGIRLHSHSSAPYIPNPHLQSTHGLNLTVYSSRLADCESGFAIEISVDWWSTIGRCATRYLAALLSWAIGIVAMLLFGIWGRSDQACRFHPFFFVLIYLNLYPFFLTKVSVPNVQKSLTMFITKTLPKLMLVSLVVAVMPLTENYYLGTRGQPILALLAPMLLFIATGAVCVSWWILVFLMWPLEKFGKSAFGR